MSHNWPFQIQSFLILALLYIGVYFCRRRSLHIKIMSSAIFLDLILILQIEFFRNAIAKAAKALQNPIMLNIHVGLAMTTVIFYFCMIYTGRKIINGHVKVQPLHRNLGRTTLILRTVTLITSFFTHT